MVHEKRDLIVSFLFINIVYSLIIIYGRKGREGNWQCLGVHNAWEESIIRLTGFWNDMLSCVDIQRQLRQ